MDQLDVGSPYDFKLRNGADSRASTTRAWSGFRAKGQLYLTLVEMQTIRAHFVSIGRDPTDIELESVAQTWSEHCSHKTLAGRIHYRGPGGDGAAKRTSANSTTCSKKRSLPPRNRFAETLGDDDWCVSVFKDNAGRGHV